MIKWLFMAACAAGCTVGCTAPVAEPRGLEFGNPAAGAPITISAAFAPIELEAVMSGISAWEAAIGQLEVVILPAVQIAQVRPEAISSSGSALPRTRDILINTPAFRMWPPVDRSSVIAAATAHELGHILGCPKHTAGGLMHAYLPDWRIEADRCIDQVAVDCVGLGQATCE